MIPAEITTSMAKGDALSVIATLSAVTVAVSFIPVGTKTPIKTGTYRHTGQFALVAPDLSITASTDLSVSADAGVTTRGSN